MRSEFASSARAHLCLIQPQAHVHALGLLDPMRVFKRHLERLGAHVTLGKNRLVEGAVNYIFGSHLGFDAALSDEYVCILVNLEQFGHGGAPSSPHHREILRRHNVVDYHPDNVVAYGADPGTPIISFDHLAELRLPSLALRDREIDLLFLGSMNKRRSDIIGRIEESGTPVTVVDKPVFAGERDDLVRRAKAVLNISAYETPRFEQVRASFALSCGTPLVSERRAWSSARDNRFEPYVHWFDASNIESWFDAYFLSRDFFDTSQRMLDAWEAFDTHDEYERMWLMHRSLLDIKATHPRPPRRMKLGISGGEYEMGWLNVGADAVTLPDVVANSSELKVPLPCAASRWPGLALERGSLDLIEVAKGAGDITEQMRFALDVLVEGGRAVVSWPVEAPIDPLEDFTEMYWRSGSKTHRFEVTRSDLIDERGGSAEATQATHIRIVMIKRRLDGFESTKVLVALDDIESALYAGSA